MVQLLLFSRGRLGRHLAVAYTSKFLFLCFLSRPVWRSRRRYRGPAHPMQTFLLTVLKTLLWFRVFAFVSATLLPNSGNTPLKLPSRIVSLIVCNYLPVCYTWCTVVQLPVLSSSDPLDWSCVHVQKWLLWTEHLYRLPQVSTMFQELTGRDLCSMTEADFRHRSSQFGDVLYAHLDIWRSSKNCRDK